MFEATSVFDSVVWSIFEWSVVCLSILFTVLFLSYF